MLNWNGFACLLLRHDFTDITSGGSLYRNCLRCGKTELKHYHPRLRRLDRPTALLVPVPIISRIDSHVYDENGR